MTTQLPVIGEYHSGDLGASCPHKVLLKRLGKVAGEAPTALWRGSVADDALTDLHQTGNWTVAGVNEAVLRAEIVVAERMAQEGRKLTDAVVSNREENLAEVQRVLISYAKRLGPMWSACELIGCQLPIRITIKDGENDPVYFASHLDLLVRDPSNVFGQGNGRLILTDFKWTQTSPTHHYLSRWEQGILYTLAIRHGSVQIDGDWVRIMDWPATAWLHLPNLKPYGKKVTTKVDGKEMDFVKGDDRPLQKIMKFVDLKEDRAGDMAEYLLTKPRMMRQGFYPCIPDPIGCWMCESQEFCSRFDMEKTDYDL